MRRIFLVLVFVALHFICPVVLSAQDERLSASVFFRQDESVIDSAYGGNGACLSAYVSELRQLMSESSLNLRKIVIRSSASPEGPWKYNLYLSRKRCESIRSYLSDALDLSPSLFVLEPVGADWAGLRRLVLKYPVPNRESVLAVLDSCLAYGGPTELQSLRCKVRLDTLYGRKPFNWIYEHLYPVLRSGTGSSVSCYFSPVLPSIEECRHFGRDTVWSFSRDTVVLLTRDTVYVAVDGFGVSGDSGIHYRHHSARRVRTREDYSFLLSSNIPFDCVLCPNLAVEFPAGRRVSVLLEGTFPWFVSSDDTRTMQLHSVALETRLWLGDRRRRDVMTGWFVGAYGSAFRGDVGWACRGVQVRNAWHAGLSVGYACSFGRRSNWRMEIYAGGGYSPVEYDRYVLGTVDGSSALVRTGGGVCEWWGPTRFGLTLGGLIPGNRSSKREKGGVR